MPLIEASIRVSNNLKLTSFVESETNLRKSEILFSCNICFKNSSLTKGALETNTAYK